MKLALDHIDGLPKQALDIDVHGEPKIDVRTLHMLIKRSDEREKAREEGYDA